MNNQPGLILTANDYENLLRLAAASRFIRRHGIRKLAVARWNDSTTEFQLAA